MLKRSLIFNKFYNQSEEYEKNLKNYEINFEKLYFSLENDDLKYKWMLIGKNKKTHLSLDLELFPGWNHLEQFSGKVLIENYKKKSEENSFYFYIMVEPFLEPLRNIKKIEDFQDFQNQGIKHVKHIIISNMYPSMSHVDYLNWENKVYFK